MLAMIYGTLSVLGCVCGSILADVGSNDAIKTFGWCAFALFGMSAGYFIGTVYESRCKHEV